MILGIDTPQLLNTFGFYSTGDELPDGRDAIETKAFYPVGQSHKLQSSNTQPVQVELIPTQTVARRSGISVMVVMPAFTKRQQRYPPAIARVVTGFESRFPPQVCSRIDEPCRVQA